MTLTSLRRLALLLTALAARPALPQQNTPTTLHRGSEVRVTLAGSTLPVHPATGQKITLLGADSMFVWVSGISRAKQDTIAYQALYSMEVREGQYTRQGAVARAAVGVAGLESIGFIVAAIIKPRSVQDPDYWRSLGRWVGGGAALGAMFGAAASTDRWHAIHPPLQVVSPADSTGAR